MWVYQQSETGDGGHLYELRNDDTGEVLGPFVSPSGVNGVLARPGLEKWLQWNVAYGMATRPDLQKLALAGGFGSKELKKATWEALQAGKTAANTGTAYHKVSEQISTAEDAFNVAAELRPWAERFGRLLDEHGIVIRQREVVVVNLEHGYAGQTDAMCLHNRLKRIADTKTGGRPYFEVAMQLAAYANATHALVNGELVELPADIDREIGLIFHVPAEGDGADLVEVEIGVGWEAFKAALTLKKILDGQPNGPVGQIVTPTHRFSDEYLGWITRRLSQLQETHPQIVEGFRTWRAGRFGERPADQFSTDELEECLTQIKAAETAHGVAFPDQPYPHPHGPRLSYAEAAGIRDRIYALPKWAQQKVTDAKRGMPELQMWRTTEAETFVTEHLAPAELDARTVLTAVFDLKAQAGEHWVTLARAFTGLEMTEWGWVEFNVYGCLVEAHLDGLLTIGDDGQLNIIPTVVDRLVGKHGTKSDVTKHIRARLEQIGLERTVPRAIAECCTDPVLVALAA